MLANFGGNTFDFEAATIKSKCDCHYKSPIEEQKH